MAPSRAQRLLLLWATFNTVLVQASPTPATPALSSPTSTAGLTLSTSITNFVPSCALTCFESFIEINFNTSLCGSVPTLECLCQHTGSTGYTLGEGATVCIVAEDNLGNCQNSGYGSETVDTAYGMCNGIHFAAPETHATLVATLIVNSGSVVVASPTPTSSTDQSSTTIAMTPTSTPTSTSSTAATTTAAPTHASITSSSTSTSTSIAATAPPSSTSPATASPSLTRAQIGGIAAGIAAIALLAALLALFLFLRRRKQLRTSPAFARMYDNSTWPPKHGGITATTHGSPNGGGSLSISQPRYQEPKVMSFTRALAKRVSMKPGRRPAPSPMSPNYGLAISPASSGRKLGTGVGLDRVVRSPVGAPTLIVRNVPPSPEQPRRVYSPPSQQPQPQPPPVPPMSPRRALSSFNFLPQDTATHQQQQQQQQQQPRPTLALAIPQRASTQGGRDSVITEFAEDGEDGGGPGSAQIWRPPQSADPSSAAASTYYVADRWGNWVLRSNDNNREQHTLDGNPAAELATPISKTREERAREEKEEGDVLVAESAAVRELRHYSSPTVPEALMVGGAGGNKRASAAGRATIRLVTPESGRLPINSRGRSSVYSNRPSLQPYATVTPGPENPMPQYTPNEAMLRSGDGAAYPRRTSSRNAAAAKRPSPERQASRESATTIMSVDSASTEIADSSPVEDMINAALDDLVFPQPPRTPPQQQQQQGAFANNFNSNRNLSPVVESPAAPATGRASPVRYPQIPPAQSKNSSSNTAANNKYQALGPNKRPLPNPLLVRLAAQDQQNPLKDSPTLGKLAVIPPTQQQQQHQRQPSDRALLPSQRLSVYDTYNDPSSPPAAAPAQRIAYTNPNAPAFAPAQQGSRLRAAPAQPEQRPRLAPGQAYVSPQQQQQRTVSPPQTYMPSPPSASEDEYRIGGRPQQPSASSTATISNASAVSSASTNSLLLAKRLGAERAAEFQRIDHERHQQQRGGAWVSNKNLPVPRGVVVRSVDGNSGGGGGRSPGRRYDVEWKPQLTPRRQGEELYLSVQ